MTIKAGAGAAADLKGLPGVWSAAKTLAAIGPKQLDVLWHHARWAPSPLHRASALLCWRPPTPVISQGVSAFKLTHEASIPFAVLWLLWADTGVRIASCPKHN